MVSFRTIKKSLAPKRLASMLPIEFESPPPVRALRFHEKNMYENNCDDVSVLFVGYVDSNHVTEKNKNQERRTYQLWNFFGPLPEELFTNCGVPADDKSPMRCFSTQSSILLASSRFLS
jgi:hypothetical protein